MNVTCHQAFEDSKLIVWASRIVYERELFVPQSWLLRENLSMPASETPSSGQKDGNPSDSPNVNRSVCSYCKRIMVLVGDIDPQIANALIDSSSAMPASMIYDDQIPFLGARGRRGIQPVTAMTASSSTPNDSSTLLQGSTDVSQCFRGSVPSSAGSIGTKDVSDGATSINCAAPASSAINLAGSVGVPSETVVEPPSIQLSVQQVVSHLWLSPYQYYYVAKLSDAGVSITNSVCEVCYGEIGYLFFRRGTFVGGVRQPVVTALGDCVANVHEAEVRRLIDGETRTLAGQSSGRKRKSDGGSASSTVSGSAGGGGSGTNFGNPMGEYTGLPADKRQRGVAPKPTRLSISDVASGGF
ncbi:hypothetical protein HDU82_008376 [Entophlyctis luteolus]|nr:hypothetical protein HDU82_008376 [Entophlyctis luteolus]